VTGSIWGFCAACGMNRNFKFAFENIQNLDDVVRLRAKPVTEPVYRCPKCLEEHKPAPPPPKLQALDRIKAVKPAIERKYRCKRILRMVQS